MKQRKLKVSEEEYFTLRSEETINNVEKEYVRQLEEVKQSKSKYYKDREVEYESILIYEQFSNVLFYIYETYSDLETRVKKFETFLSRFTKDQFKKYDLERCKSFSIFYFLSELYAQEDHFTEKQYDEVCEYYSEVF